MKKGAKKEAQKELDKKIKALRDTLPDSFANIERCNANAIVNNLALKMDVPDNIYGFERKKFEDKNNKRPFIFKEIITTEETYLESFNNLSKENLSKALEIYGKSPAKKNTDTMSQQDFLNLINKMKEFENAQKEFLEALKQPNQGQWIDKMKALQSHYAEYAILYGNANFPEGISKVKEGKSTLDLGSTLITPIQRAPRYGLLLQDLLNNTPETHPQYKAFQELHNNAIKIAQTMNTEKAKVDAKEKVNTALENYNKKSNATNTTSVLIALSDQNLDSDLRYRVLRELNIDQFKDKEKEDILNKVKTAIFNKSKPGEVRLYESMQFKEKFNIKEPHIYSESNNANGLTVMSDCDETLATGNANTVNENLIAAWKEKGIKEIYLCTGMDLREASDEAIVTRAQTISKLESKGIQVKGVITSQDMILYCGQQRYKNNDYFPQLHELVDLKNMNKKERKEVEKAFNKIQQICVSDSVMGKYYSEIISPMYKKDKASIINDPEYKAFKLLEAKLTDAFSSDKDEYLAAKQLEGGASGKKVFLQGIAIDESKAKGFPIKRLLNFDDDPIVCNNIAKASREGVEVNSIQIAFSQAHVKKYDTNSKARITSDEIKDSIDNPNLKILAKQNMDYTNVKKSQLSVEASQIAIENPEPKQKTFEQIKVEAKRALIKLAIGNKDPNIATKLSEAQGAVIRAKTPEAIMDVMNNLPREITSDKVKDQSKGQENIKPNEVQSESKMRGKKHKTKTNKEAKPLDFSMTDILQAEKGLKNLEPKVPRKTSELGFPMKDILQAEQGLKSLEPKAQRKTSDLGFPMKDILQAEQGLKNVEPKANEPAQKHNAFGFALKFSNDNDYKKMHQLLELASFHHSLGANGTQHWKFDAKQLEKLEEMVDKSKMLAQKNKDFDTFIKYDQLLSDIKKRCSSQPQSLQNEVDTAPLLQASKSSLTLFDNAVQEMKNSREKENKKKIEQDFTNVTRMKPGGLGKS